MSTLSSVQQPVTPTGGMFGAIRSVLLANQSISQIVGTRISPGRAASGWTSANASATLPASFPLIIISDVGATFHHDVLSGNKRIDVYDTVLQIAVYGNSYEQARALSSLVHGVIRQAGFFNVDGSAVWLQPVSSHQLLTPKRSETAADIWQMTRRYRYWQQDGISPTSTLSTVNANGTLNIPGFSSSGNGAAS